MSPPKQPFHGKACGGGPRRLKLMASRPARRRFKRPQSRRRLRLRPRGQTHKSRCYTNEESKIFKKRDTRGHPINPKRPFIHVCPSLCFLAFVSFQAAVLLLRLWVTSAGQQRRRYPEPAQTCTRSLYATFGLSRWQKRTLNRLLLVHFVLIELFSRP